MSEQWKNPGQVLVKGYGMQPIPESITSQSQLKAYLSVNFPPKRDVSVGADIANLTKSAIAKGAISLPGAPVDIARMVSGAGNFVQDRLYGALGVPQEMVRQVRERSASPVDLLASVPFGSQEILGAVERGTGRVLSATPQTDVGKTLERPIDMMGAVLVQRNPLKLFSRGATGTAARETLTAGAGGLAGEGVSALNQRFDPGESSGAAELAANIATQAALSRIGKKDASSELKKRAPSAEEFGQSVKSAWKEVDDLGVRVMPTELNSRISSLDPLYSNPKLFPKTSGWIDVLRSQSPQKYTFDWLQRTRSLIAKDLRKGDLGAEEVSLLELKNSIDDAIESGSFNTKGGTPLTSGEVANKVKKARSLSFQERNSEILEEAMRVGANYAGRETVGIRQQFLNILKNPKLYSRFSKDEQKFIESAARSNETAGKLAGIIDDIGTSGAIGAAPGGGFLPAIAMKALSSLASGVIRGGSDRRIVRSAETALASVRGGEPARRAAMEAERADILRRSRQLRKGTLGGLYTEGILGAPLEEGQ